MSELWKILEAEAEIESVLLRLRNEGKSPESIFAALWIHATFAMMAAPERFGPIKDEITNRVSLHKAIRDNWTVRLQENPRPDRYQTFHEQVLG